MDSRYVQRIELLYLLVLKELKVRYKRSVLGYLWAIANPFAFALVYWFAFKYIMRVQIPNYSIFLLTGMFPWGWLANSLIHASSSYRNNASLIKKVKLERALLPLSSVVHEMLHFCFSLPVLSVFIFISGGPFYLAWFWQMPLMILLQLTFLYPLALILAITNVYVHDVEYIVGIALSMLFFLTPIVYPPEMVPAQFTDYINYSPLSALIGNWHNVFLRGNIQFDQFAYCLSISLVLWLIAYHFYRRRSIRLGELL